MIFFLKKLNISKLLLVISILSFCIVFCNRVYKVYLHYPDIGGYESTIVRKIQQVIQDKNSLYTDPAKPNFEITQYTPFYFFIVSGISKLFGYSENSILEVFVVNRWVCIFLNLFTVLIIFQLCFNVLKINKLKSIIASLFYFIIITPPFYGRMDSLSSLFFVLSFYYFLKYYKFNNTIWDLIFSVICLLMATFSKQHYLLIFPFYSLFYLNKLKPMLVILLGGFCTLLLMFVYNNIHPYFFSNIINGLNNGIDFSLFVKEIGINFFLKGGLFLLICIYYIANNFSSKNNLIALPIFCFLWFLFNLVASTKMGGSSSYFQEVYLFSFITVLYYNINNGNNVINIIFLITVIYYCSTNFGFIFNKKTQLESAKNNLIFQDELVLSKKLYKLNTTNKLLSIYTPVYFNHSYFGNIFLQNNFIPQKDIIFNCAFQFKVFPYKQVNNYLTNGINIDFYIVKKQKENDLLEKYFDNYKLVDSTIFYYIYKK